LGSERPERVDVRILAATNRNLEDEVTARLFRADLYYRLAVVTLSIPPLRQRHEDIPVLVQRYLGYFRRTLGKHVDELEPEALAALVRHEWPGNVRELINVLERALLLAHGPRITLGDLPRSISGGGARPGNPAAAAPATLPLRDARRVAVDGFELDYVSGLLTATRGRVGEAARLAGVSERALYALMKKTGLTKEEFRP